MSEQLKEKYPRLSEGNESPELFRGTLAFDFIFARNKEGEKIAYCNEINGHAAGGGAAFQLIPKGQIDEQKRLIGKLRFVNSQEYFDRLQSIQSDTEIDPARKRELIEELDREPKPHAFRNPPFIAAITENKQMQQEYIPAENRLREYKDGESPISSTGFWICKPKGGEMGQGISILNNAEFRDHYIGKMEQQYVAQEFVQALGADNAPKEMYNNRASMRFHLDFRYLHNGTIQPIYETAFQRISGLPTNDDQLRDRAMLEKAAIVNVGSGRTIAVPSEEEIELTRPVVEKIIHNIAQAYKESL